MLLRASGGNDDRLQALTVVGRIEKLTPIASPENVSEPCGADMAGAIHPVAVEDDPLRRFRAPGCHCPIDATARKRIVDLAGRQEQFGGGPIYRGATRHRPIEELAQRTGYRARCHPLFVGSFGSARLLWNVKSVRQIERSLKSLARNRGRLAAQT
jgi:hypothetical protein